MQLNPTLVLEALQAYEHQLDVMRRMRAHVLEQSGFEQGQRVTSKLQGGEFVVDRASVSFQTRRDRVEIVTRIAARKPGAAVDTYLTIDEVQAL